MAENSKIEWTDHTFNPWRGCTKVSSGCANCYAETMSGRNPKVLGVWGPQGTRVLASEAQWKEPLKWDRQAGEAKKRQLVFCASLADVFEDWQGPMVNAKGTTVVRGEWQECLERHDEPLTMDYFRFELFNLIRRTPNLDWLLLTKRPENIGRMMAGYLGAWDTDHIPNVWLGVSVENQATADERIPVLLRIPAAVRFLSCEPLLGPVDLSKWLACNCPADYAKWPGDDSHNHWCPRSHSPERVLSQLHWVIVGGESGHGARPCELDWLRSLRDQCAAAGVAFFNKQIGSRPLRSQWHGNPSVQIQVPFETKDRKGGDWLEWPMDLRVRQFPAVEGAAHA